MRRTWRTALASAGAVVCLVSISTRAQERKVPPAVTSELGRENLSRVAASAADIKSILVKDTGLMVELKRWVAREATAQGQIITDVELSDEAIYDRLVSDVQFRSVATTLVQRYAYLVPQLNPDSAAGKEQEFVAMERAKLAARRQEEESATPAKNQRGLQRTDFCGDSRVDNSDCGTLENPDREQGSTQPRQEQRYQEYPPSQTGPGQANPQSAPQRNGAIERTQYSPGGRRGRQRRSTNFERAAEPKRCGRARCLWSRHQPGDTGDRAQSLLARRPEYRPDDNECWCVFECGHPADGSKGASATRGAASSRIGARGQSL
jgi:hypothetical protein